MWRLTREASRWPGSWPECDQLTRGLGNLIAIAVARSADASTLVAEIERSLEKPVSMMAVCRWACNPKGCLAALDVDHPEAEARQGFQKLTDGTDPFTPLAVW